MNSQREFRTDHIARRGFTLIELLVVIVIISALVALLLPAIQQARESARKTNCRNNLKQVGLAMQIYHDANGSFPIGGYSSWKGAIPAAGTSFWVGLLPGLDQGPMFARIDMNTTASGDVMLGTTIGSCINGYRIPSLLCPSSPLPSMIPVSSLVTPFSFQVMTPSYMGVSGAAPDGTFGGTFPEPRIQNFSPATLVGGVNGQMSWGGLLVANDVVRMSDATDGLSQVMLIGESSDYIQQIGTTTKVRSDGAYGNGWTYGTTSTGTTSTYFNSNVNQTTRAFNLTTLRHPVGFRFWPAIVSIGNLAQFPNRPIISAHTGGASVLLGDGSVWFLSENLDVTILKRLATRDDGQISPDL